MRIIGGHQEVKEDVYYSDKTAEILSMCANIPSILSRRECVVDLESVLMDIEKVS